MNSEELTMKLITHGGAARSKSMEAIALAKDGKIAEARGALAEAGAALTEAHKSQAELIQAEADGEVIPPSLLLIHAQDHLMNAITVKDLASEFVELYERSLKGASQ